MTRTRKEGHRGGRIGYAIERMRGQPGASMAGKNSSNFGSLDKITKIFFKKTKACHFFSDNTTQIDID